MADPQSRCEETTRQLGRIDRMGQLQSGSSQLNECPNTQAKHPLFCLLRHSVSALTEIKEKVQRNSLTQIIQCCPTDKKAVMYLKELNASEIKESILFHLDNDLRQSQSGVARRAGDENGQTREKQHGGCSRQKIGQIGRDYLLQLVQQVSTYLRKKQTQKMVYNFINFQWTSNIVQHFIAALEQQMLQPQANGSESAEENAKQNLKPTPQTEQICEDETDFGGIVANEVIGLLNRIDDKKVARGLYLSISNLTRDVTRKQAELQYSKRHTEELAGLLTDQMEIIEQLSKENHQLQQQINTSGSEFESLRNRCNGLENELTSAVETFEHFKEQSKKQQYYLNPLWEKAKIQEKYMSEIIQLESDLYLQKIQVKQLVNLVLEQIKLTHNALYDLGSSNYFITKFDRVLYKRLKMLKAFDGVNLEECLVLREESLLEESDSIHDMHKSTISTYSSIQMENRHPMFAEESFDNFTQQND